MKKFWAGIHILFTAFVVSSVLWIQWYVLLLIFVVLRIQDAILGGCILTRLEYGSYERRFFATKKHLLPDRIKHFFPLITDWVAPGALVFISYLVK